MVIRGTHRDRERPAALPCLSVACVVKRMRFDSEVKTGLYFGCCTVWRVDGLKLGLFQVAQLRRQAPAEDIAAPGSMAVTEATAREDVRRLAEATASAA